ncbi:2TM domain-containing protein [Balneola sp. MJW-20]|uniref:2TM domain-containing protein n=1 Tax=Gracilimonas aurantiaca TaxID=3234185 RepID=UPI0034662EE3
MNNLNEEQIIELAKKRVDLRHHLMVYIIINAMLWAIWAITGSGYIWPIWPTAGWGIALIFHYVGVHDPFALFSVEKEIEKMKKERG